MARPCTCERVKVDQPYDLSQCRLCWLYHHDEFYRALWDESPPPEPEAPPGLWAKIKHFGAAAYRYVASGLKNVSEEEYQRRLGICRSCPFWKDDWCHKCGCNLAGDMVAKARWASERCPDDPPRW